MCADGCAMQIGRLVGSGVAGLGLVGASYLGLAGEDNTTRDETGAVVEGGEVGAFRIQLGDCLLDSPDGDFESIEAVPCDESHQSEVYAAFNVPFSEIAAFPGRDSIRAAADDGCLAEFEAFVGRSYELSVYGISSITPTEGSWDEFDDREVLCLVSNFDGTPKVGSARDTDA